MLLPLLLLWLPLAKANSTTSEYLEETSECVKNVSHFYIKEPTSSLGSKNFTELVRTNDFFVDKSLLLKEIFNEKSSYMIVFYLPSTFSKTTNLRMIQTFFGIEFHPNTFRVDRLHTWAYNFFAEGKILGQNRTVASHLITPPLISNHTDFVYMNLIKYAIVYFDFSDVHDIDYATTWNCIRDRIGRQFLKYHFLSNRLHADKAERYAKLVDYFNTTQWSIDPPKEYIDLPEAVNFFAESAGKYFPLKPILCIDNYDALLEAFLYRRHTTPEESDKVFQFFNDFVEKVLGVDDLWTKIILTGTHSVHKTIMKELPGTKAIYNAFENDLSHFFGFTETDVRTMSKHFPDSERKLERILEYYKGYQMSQNRLVYNPWSIMKSLSTGKLKNYWTKKRRHSRFMTNFWVLRDLRELLLDLLHDREISVYYRWEKFTKDDFRSLQKTLSMGASTGLSPEQYPNLTSKEVNQVVLHWIDLGYLTCSNTSAHNLRAANLEIKTSMFEGLRQAYKGYFAVNVDQIDVVTANLHAYLFSRERGKLIDELTQSFDKLFNETEQLFEGNITAGEGKVVNSSSTRIIEYMGLQLRYRHDHNLDRNISNGFITSKLGVFSMVIFNYNQSIANVDVLNEIVNNKHPWFEQDPERLTTSVTYLVIGVKNGTEIVEKRLGVEPPEDVTKPVSKEEVRTTTKKKHTPASKKFKNASQSQPKSTRPFNKTGWTTKKSNRSTNLTPQRQTSTKKFTSGGTGLSTTGIRVTNATINATNGTKTHTQADSRTTKSTNSATIGTKTHTQPNSTTAKSTNSTILTPQEPISTSKFTPEGTRSLTESQTTGISATEATNTQSSNTTMPEEKPVTRVKRSTPSTLLTTEGPKSESNSDPKVTNPETTTAQSTKSVETTTPTSFQQPASANSTFKGKGSKSNFKTTKSTTELPKTHTKTTNTATDLSENTNPASTIADTVIQPSPLTDSISKESKLASNSDPKITSEIKVTNPDTTSVSNTKSEETPKFTKIQRSPSGNFTFKGRGSKSNLNKITKPTTELSATDLKTTNTATAQSENTNLAETSPNTGTHSSSSPGSISKGSKSASKGTKAPKNWTRGTKFTKADRKPFTTPIASDQSQMPAESRTFKTKGTKLITTTTTKLPSYSTWEYVSWKRRPKPTYSTKSTTLISRKKFLQLFFMVRDCDLRPDRKNPYYYQTIKTTKKVYTDRK